MQESGKDRAAYERELQINRLQKELIARMAPNEVLFLFPWEHKEPMRELE